MSTPEQETRTLINKIGAKGLQTAKESLNNPQIPPPIKNVAQYFIDENWPNTHHPALMALCCQAVNGDPNQTYEISAAIVLMTGAADIHDDIIDNTKTKNKKPTAYGKFDKDLVLLTGDMLLFQGMALLHGALEKLPSNTRQAVYASVEQSFFKIGNSIATERCLRGKPVNLAEYRQAIESKGSVAQACAEIGAIIGQGNPEEIQTLSDYGKTIGVLNSLKNEFEDMLDPNEFNSKIKNKILPLPVLFAAQDNSAILKINSLLQGKLTKRKAQSIVDIALETEPVKKLLKEILTLSQKQEKAIHKIKNNKDVLKLILKTSTFKA
jgi:geranylgeranyl pyrophosphate synthase